MKKTVSSLLVSVLIASFAAPAFAQKGWRLFAGTEEDFVFKPTASIMAGMLDSSKVGDSGMAYGLEASFMCPLIQNPTNNMRQQISVVNFTDGDNSQLNVEANLHYRMPIVNNLKLGFGPGLGFVRTDVRNVTSNMLGLQAGASLHYNMDKLFVGAEARYQITQRDTVGREKDSGADNWRAMLKIGYNL